MGRLLVLSEYRLEYYGGLLLLLFLLLHISIKLFFSSLFLVVVALPVFAAFLRVRGVNRRRAQKCWCAIAKTEVEEYFPFHSFEYLDTHFLWAQFALEFFGFTAHIFSVNLALIHYSLSTLSTSSPRPGRGTILIPSSPTAHNFIWASWTIFLGDIFFVKIHDGLRLGGWATRQE